jgi:hypothetical protein
VNDPPPLTRPRVVMVANVNALASISLGDLTVDDLRSMQDYYAMLSTRLGGTTPLYALAIIGPGSRPPSAEARAELANVSPSAPKAQAVILENLGLATALVRSVMATVQFLSPRAVKTEAFREASEGYRWLIGRATADGATLPPWEQFSRTVDTVRALAKR